MTDRTHPDSGRIITSSDVIADLQDRIAELEAQLSSSGFTAADMATAEARGFRDGVASVAANAGEPMFWVRLCGDGLYEGPIHNARIEEVRKQSGVWSPLYLAAPPTAQAEGWVSVEERLPPVRTTVFIASGAGPSAWRTLAFYDPDRYQPAWRCNDDPSEGIRGVSHWMHMPLPPTSAEGV